MTTLDRRPVRRETNVIDGTRSGRRPLIILLEVGGKIVRIKPKGTRRWYAVPYEEIYRSAIRIRHQELKAERAARKSERHGK